MANESDRGSRVIEIAASQEVVWGLVSDITRYGEWSPETYRAEWVSGTGAVGNRFRGYNRSEELAKSWWSECEVTAWTPPDVFAFETRRVDFGDGPHDLAVSTAWRYEITQTEDPGTISVELSYVNPGFTDPESAVSKNGRYETLGTGAEQTLRNIKATLDKSATAR